MTTARELLEAMTPYDYDDPLDRLPDDRERGTETAKQFAMRSHPLNFDEFAKSLGMVPATLKDTDKNQGWFLAYFKNVRLDPFIMYRNRPEIKTSKVLIRLSFRRMSHLTFYARLRVRLYYRKPGEALEVYRHSQTLIKSLPVISKMNRDAISRMRNEISSTVNALDRFLANPDVKSGSQIQGRLYAIVRGYEK